MRKKARGNAHIHKKVEWQTVRCQILKQWCLKGHIGPQTGVWTHDYNSPRLDCTDMPGTTRGHGIGITISHSVTESSIYILVRNKGQRANSVIQCLLFPRMRTWLFSSEPMHTVVAHAGNHSAGDSKREVHLWGFLLSQCSWIGEFQYGLTQNTMHPWHSEKWHPEVKCSLHEYMSEHAHMCIYTCENDRHCGHKHS